MPSNNIESFISP